jgi:hypothetical protein
MDTEDMNAQRRVELARMLHPKATFFDTITLIRRDLLLHDLTSGYAESATGWPTRTMSAIAYV